MKLILDGKEFDHIDDKSCYNNNYYKHRETGILIFEHCDEQYDTNEYTDVTDPKNHYFLGCSPCPNGEGLYYNGRVEIEFKINY